MQSSHKMFKKRFYLMLRVQILLGTWILIISFAAFCFQVQEKEKWVPDYNQRDEWQQPEKILDAIGIRSGMTVADVGAGTGYFTFRLAERVGPEGKVYANDINEANLKKIQDRIKEEGTKNIITILGQQDDPGLPEGQIEIILMVHVIHIIIHDQDPFSFLENLRPSLKPDSLLVIVHWDGEKMGYPDVYAYSQESLLTVMEKSNFKLVRVETFLPRDNIYIFQVK